jgi:hypothetical protein
LPQKAKIDFKEFTGAQTRPQWPRPPEPNLTILNNQYPFRYSIRKRQHKTGSIGGRQKQKSFPGRSFAFKLPTSSQNISDRTEIKSRRQLR